MDSITKLAKLLERFPGVGPRQAHRFVHYLLRTSSAQRRELATAIRNLEGAVMQCEMCMRFHDSGGALCTTCSAEKRDPSLLMIVASDTDRDAVEQSGTYSGHYFILGGTYPLSGETPAHIRESALARVLTARAPEGLAEIILAFPAHPEGDATVDILRARIAEHAPDARITTLGRGLSTGSELEYADPDTIKNAFQNRR